MSKVVLHIGTHKTATTTIQDTFWANAELLWQNGICYPRQGRATGHHGLVFDWGRLPEVYRLPEGSRAALAQIAANHGDSDRTVFLSSEEFSRGDPAGAVDFAELREILSPFDEIEVICTLRPQWQFLQSIYLELSKKRLPPRPPQVVKPVLEKGMFAGLWIDYTLLLDHLETVFAPQEITFVDFETVRRSEGGILNHYLRHLGAGISAEDLEQVNGGTSNVSPVSLASWAANIVADPKVAPAWLVEMATQELRAHCGEDVKPCLFTRGEFSSLAEHFNGRNAVLNDRRRAVQPDFALAANDPAGLTLFRDDLPAAFWVGMSRRLAGPQLGKDGTGPATAAGTTPPHSP